MRNYTILQAATSSRRKTRGRGFLWLVVLVLLAGAGWFAWDRGWWPRQDLARFPVPETNTTVTPSPPAPGLSTAVVLRPVIPVAFTNGDSARVTTVLEAQIALDRLALSPGSIDGVSGSQTRAALRVFQSRAGLPPTGELDGDTRARLALRAPALGTYRVENGDLARLRPLAANWLGKSEQGPLEFETLLELIAERSHAHPALLRQLNAAWDGGLLPAGMELVVPVTERAAPQAKAAWIQIGLSARTLQVFDENNQLLAHFPCSIAQRVEKRPVGELRVAVVAPNPNYTFDPDVFPESAEARQIGRKLILAPGPNNPVGAVWIGLDKPGYGIHGTPKPEDVGRTESHGCFRLANWNAEYLLQMVTVGTVVRVEP